jgi:hypothetical protein
MSYDASYLNKRGFKTRVDDQAEIIEGNVEGNDETGNVDGNVKGNDKARNVRSSLPGGKLHIRENMAGGVLRTSTPPR